MPKYSPFVVTCVGVRLPEVEAENPKDALEKALTCAADNEVFYRLFSERDLRTKDGTVSVNGWSEGHHAALVDELDEDGDIADEHYFDAEPHGQGWVTQNEEDNAHRTEQAAGAGAAT